jgi:hypothetical protein
MLTSYVVCSASQQRQRTSSFSYFFDENYSAIPSFLNKYGYDDNED